MVQSWTWVKGAAPAIPPINSKMRIWTVFSMRSGREPAASADPGRVTLMTRADLTFWGCSRVGLPGSCH